MRQTKIVIPHEHGGWAMAIVPFLFGMAAGTPRWMHVLLFLAWFLLYLSTYPFLQCFKRKANRVRLIRWGAGYGAAALLLLIMPVIDTPQLLWFGLPFAALLAVNVVFAMRRSERAFVNDCCAILSFSLAGAAAYLAGGGTWDLTMAVIVLFNFIYFLGTVFFVKTIFRERNNKQWTTYAYVYHILVLIVPILIGYTWMIIPFLYPLLRTVLFAGKQVKPMKAGIIEIIGSVQFLILSIILFT